MKDDREMIKNGIEVKEVGNVWEKTKKKEKIFLAESSTHLMNRLMHVHVMMRRHWLKVQMLLISLRL